MSIKYIIDNNPKQSDDKIIQDGLFSFNSKIINDEAKHFSIFVKDNSKIVGGALIWEHKDALYIDTLWVQDDYRGHGVGDSILNMIIDEANKKELQKIFVDTFDFQAYQFYTKYQFKEIGRAPEYLLGHDRIFLKRSV